jgi:hypothetical protein
MLPLLRIANKITRLLTSNVKAPLLAQSARSGASIRYFDLT